MEAASRRVNSCGSGESAEANGKAQATNGDDGGASTLQHSEYHARPIEERDVDEKHLRARRACSRLRTVHRILCGFSEGRTHGSLVRTGESISDRRRRGAEG